MDRSLRDLADDGGITNIVLFVGDAVRYQSIGDRLKRHGPTFKTIAASLHTPASFASMLTGRHVPEHGVVGFANVVPDDVTSLVDLEGWNTYFSAKTGTMHEDLHRIFQMRDSTALADAEPPFIWIVRDPGGHAPYNGYSAETYDQQQETGPEYLNRVAGDQAKIRGDYHEALDASIDRFEAAIDCIRARGLADETLCIYTSDHGELLGEYGILGHNHVATPELVYVPTTFVHPSLSNGIRASTMRHIDLVPTITHLLDADRPDPAALAGHPVWGVSDPIGYNHFEMVFYDNSMLSDIQTEVKSCWDKDGGHVFVESSYLHSFLVYLGILTLSYKGKQIRSDRKFIESLQQFMPGHRTHGTPSFDKARAEAYVEDVPVRAGDPERAPMTPETKQRLEDLGYI